MRRLGIAFALLVVSLPLLAGSRYGREHISCGVCVTPRVDDVTDCDDLHVIMQDRDAVTQEETVAVGNVRTLNVRAPQNGGIYVRRGTGSAFAVRACKAAQFDESLDGVKVTFSGNTLTARGADYKTWLVYFLIEMPRGARAELETTNGPIDIRDVDGTIVAHAENGPVAAKDTSGSMRLTAQNGPVAFSGSTGNVVLRTANGPVAVDLQSTFWQSGTLDARTDNGPVALTIPRRYRSGVLVTTNGNSPVKCHAEECRGARSRTWDDEDRYPRRIELGSGSKVVTLATDNGPVSIEDH